MEKKEDRVPYSDQGRGELLSIIKVWARDRFLELETGTKEDFEEIWREAFFAAAEPSLKT